jgi:HAMP domain-containing protein
LHVTGTDADILRAMTARLCEQLAELRELAAEEDAAVRFGRLVRTVAQGPTDEVAEALREIDELLRQWGDPLGLDGQVRGRQGSLDTTGQFLDHPVEEFYVCPRDRCRHSVRRLLRTPAPHCALHDTEYALLRLDEDS